MSHKPDEHTSPNFLCMLTVAVARSSSDDSVIRYVLLVLWMTSFFLMMAPMSQNQRQRYVLSSSPGGGTGGEVAVYDCRLVNVCDFYWKLRKAHTLVFRLLKVILSFIVPKGQKYFALLGVKFGMKD